MATKGTKPQALFMGDEHTPEMPLPPEERGTGQAADVDARRADYLWQSLHSLRGR
jgi:hypothetical protein